MLIIKIFKLTCFQKKKEEENFYTNQFQQLKLSLNYKIYFLLTPMGFTMNVIGVCVELVPCRKADILYICCLHGRNFRQPYQRV